MKISRRIQVSGMVVAVGLSAVSIAAAKESSKDLDDAKCVAASTATTGPGHFSFVPSVCLNASESLMTLPLQRGVSHGKTVWYVVINSSDQADAAARGVTFVPKLRNLIGTDAVQTVSVSHGVIDFPHTVTFGLDRVLVPGPNGFPPSKASPPAAGEDGYSPFINLDGVVLNAPQVANDSGRADKIVRISDDHSKVVYKTTQGFYENKFVHYGSFDSSSPVAAAIEDVTFAPAMNAAPTLGDESDASARLGLVAFINGPVGANNPERQGLSSTLLDGLDPRNLLHNSPVIANPGDAHGDVGCNHPNTADNPCDNPSYSPMWDVRLVAWTQDAIDSGSRFQERDFNEAVDLVNSGKAVFVTPNNLNGASGFIVNCPIFMIDIP